MSDLFSEEAPAAARPPSRRSRALVITAVVLVVAFFGLTTFANFYTNVLWYRDVGFGSVYSRLLVTRALLFAVFGLVMAAVVAVNIVIAFRLRPLFYPGSQEQTSLDRYRQAVTPIRTWLVVAVAVVLGLFAGASASGKWRSFMLWRNGVPFEREDAYFGKDIGFFVFDLPWFHYVVDFVMAVCVVSLLAAAVVHYLYGGIRLQSPGDRLSGAAQAQLSVLLGVFVLAKAADYWLDRYDLAHRSGSLMTGITYTDDHAVLPAKSLLMGIAVICAVLFFLNVWRRTWLLPSLGLVLLVLSAILLGLIWPGIVQNFQVRPSEADKEAPYIEKHIAATRAAYDIDTVEKFKLPSSGTTATEIDAGSDPSTTSIPLVDPQLVRQAFEQNQQVRGYYSVADVLDVDRYEINGVERALVLGVRELEQRALNREVQNWLNLHTVYTHGNDIIAAFANQRSESDAPQQLGDTDKTQWAEGNQPGQDSLSEALGKYETRIYFGENSPAYSVVGKPSPDSPNVELDLTKAVAPGDGDEGSANDPTTTYTGEGGVPVGSTFRQLLYAIKFGSANFLLSGRVHENSEVIYNRDPKQRVKDVAPWLTIDGDIFPAVVDGKIVWIIDGYTTTDRFPGSERESFEEMTRDTLQEDIGLRTLPTDEINYMRNSVKATVDAYDGTVKLYAWDTEDPLLKAWSAAFPGTVTPKSEISEELMKHLRYPEDMFKVQRYQYARYHVTDPQAWFQDNNRWAVPEDPNPNGGVKSLQPPYRMFVTQPSGLVPAAGSVPNASPIPEGQVWSMTSTFVPYRRNNLAAFVSVDSDATSPTYGQIRVIDVIDQQQQGPGQVANNMRSDPRVSAELAQFNRSGNSISYGNLLTVPVGDELLYVEPVYVRLATANEANFPILRNVLVSYKGGVGIGQSLESALAAALSDAESGGGPDTPEPSPPEPTESPSPTDEPTTEPPGPGTPPGTVAELLSRAQEEFVAADQALKDGDLSAYQRHIDQAQDYVTQALALQNGGTAAPSSPATGEGE